MICIPNTCNDLHLIVSTFLVRLFRVPGVGEEGLLISYHSKEQGYPLGTYLFAVKIHLSHLSPDRLAATRNFPCLPASQVIPRQLRQSNSPNVIQSGFTCDASSSIYCCNWDVRTGCGK
jgi:hypothetical protein